MMTRLPFDHVESILAGCGFSLVAGSLEMTSADRFALCRIHPAQNPVAVLAGALTNPSVTKVRFPNYKLVHLVTKRWPIDQDDAATLAAAAGAELSLPVDETGEPYAELLREVITRHRLEDFFEQAPGRMDHYAIRPRGHGETDHEAFASVLEQWRRGYRKLDAPTQMLLALVIWLYSGGDHTIWLKGLRRSWHAVDAFIILRSNHMLVDWVRLLTMHPGY